MVDLGQDGQGGAAGGGAVPPVRPEDVQVWIEQLMRAHEGLDDVARIEMIRAIEELKNAGAAAQAVVSVDFDRSQRERAAQAGEPKVRQGRGVAAQIALARRESPWWGIRHLGLAKVFVELPCTRAAFRSGKLSEKRCRIIAQETAFLSMEHRMLIDEEVCGDPDHVATLGDRQLAAQVKKRAYALDPQGFVDRRVKAEKDRHTRVRPAPEAMAYFTALLSVKNAVLVQAALHHAAVAAHLAGDPRSHGQLMADILLDRVLNPSITDTGTTPGNGATLIVNVVVPDTVLFGNGGDADGAGWVDGFGEVPGDLLREWIADNCDDGDAEVFVRRMYENPDGHLVAMDSRSTRFEGKLAEFLRLRDRGCRTPYCDAPIKHLDHSVKKAHGGPTDAANGQGLCERCNYDKEAIGWSAQPRPGPRHTIETTTPTGHRYRSVAPQLTR